MADTLHMLTALGAAEPITHQIGTFRVTERFDVALASLACRKEHGVEFVEAAKKAGVPLPAPAMSETGSPYSSFWVAPEMWFVEAPFGTHEDIAALLKPSFGDAASITEQTDAWVRFDLSAPDLSALLARLCNVDFPKAADGFATRTVIEHTGCYLIKQTVGTVTVYGPRSSARSLLHAIDVAAQSLAE